MNRNLLLEISLNDTKSSSCVAIDSARLHPEQEAWRHPRWFGTESCRVIICLCSITLSFYKRWVIDNFPQTYAPTSQRSTVTDNTNTSFTVYIKEDSFLDSSLTSSDVLEISSFNSDFLISLSCGESFILVSVIVLSLHFLLQWHQKQL